MAKTYSRKIDTSVEGVPTVTFQYSDDEGRSSIILLNVPEHIRQFELLLREAGYANPELAKLGKDRLRAHVFVTKDEAELQRRRIKEAVETRGQEREGVSIEERLIRAAKTIRHCGDYGELWYHPDKAKVWWVGGDSDGNPLQGYTDIKEIKRKLKIEGIKQVVVEAECAPDPEGNPRARGWKNLGRRGVVINLAAAYLDKRLKTKPDNFGLGWFLLRLRGIPLDEICHVRVKDGVNYIYSFAQEYEFREGDYQCSEPKRIIGGLHPLANEAVADAYKELDN